jgi:hypothetical protein
MTDLNHTDLFRIEPINAGSINGWINIPPVFVILIYCVIILITISSVLYLVKKRVPLNQACGKSMFVAFLFAGFLYLGVPVLCYVMFFFLLYTVTEFFSGEAMFRTAIFRNTLTYYPSICFLTSLFIKDLMLGWEREANPLR